MRRIAIAAAAALLIGAAPAPRPDLSQLAWLAGAWATEGGGPSGAWTEERWPPPRGGVMLGTGLNGHGGKADSFEYMRIASDLNGGISFWGSPEGRPGIAFRLVSLTGREAVFENPLHDFPARIVYHRAGRILQATISGPGGAKAQIWRYRKIE
jgi:hypothetical protein